MTPRLKCPLMGGQDCLALECAWFVENQCVAVKIQKELFGIEVQLRKVASKV